MSWQQRAKYFKGNEADKFSWPTVKEVRNLVLSLNSLGRTLEREIEFKETTSVDTVEAMEQAVYELVQLIPTKELRELAAKRRAEVKRLMGEKK